MHKAQTFAPYSKAGALKQKIKNNTTKPLFMYYNRLTLLVITANVWLLNIFFGHLKFWNFPSENFITLNKFIIFNFALAVLIRNQQVINTLFLIATRAPLSWPLSIRKRLAKVYHFGGLHIGAALSATILFFLQATHVLSSQSPLLIKFSTSLICLLLILICLSSAPKIREKHHNLFEIIHRLGGWLTVLMFWLQSLSLASSNTQLSWTEKIFSPDILSLMAISLSVLWPWLRLKKVPLEVFKPSKHVAIARFNYGSTPFAGSSTAISRNPLLEWHSFANVPSPEKEGFRLTISRAGDWTGQFIDEPPSHVWVKGIHTAGVANIEVLFKKVLYVATGSGIGPVLPHLLKGAVPANLLWVARDHKKNFGQQLVNEVCQSTPVVHLWDTSQERKTEITQLTLDCFKKSGAEAVICISNKKTTFQVVEFLEKQGIPAYGAIWDS